MAREETRLTVTSSQFTDGGTLPKSAAHYSAGGENISPDLSWTGAPPDTASFAITLYDPDAPTTVGYTHWVLFNIDPTVRQIPAGAGASGQAPAGSTHGHTDFGANEYGGMAPPPGDPPHHYIFTVYALDVPRLDLPPTATYPLFNFSIRGHVLARGQITGLYGR